MSLIAQSCGQHLIPVPAWLSTRQHRHRINKPKRLYNRPFFASLSNLRNVFSIPTPCHYMSIKGAPISNSPIIRGARHQGEHRISSPSTEECHTRAGTNRLGIKFHQPFAHGANTNTTASTNIETQHDHRSPTISVTFCTSKSFAAALRSSVPPGDC